MRLFLLPLCWLSGILLPFFSYAQSEYRQMMDDALSNLPKDGITILYSRVYPAAHLQDYQDVPPNFSGQNTTSSLSTSSSVHFLQTRSEIREASYISDELLTPNELDALIWSSDQQRITPIGVALADIHFLNEQTVELDANNRYRLRAGYTPSDLYRRQYTAVASVLVPSVKLGITTFHLPQWAIFNNRSSDIDYVSINFGDGKPYKTLTPDGGTVQVQYVSAGTKTILYDIRLKDGTTLAVQSTLEVENALRIEYPIVENGSISVDSIRFEASISFQGYDESSPEKGKGDALIYYARGRSQIRKPIIFIDGFDPADARKASSLYSENLSYYDATGSLRNLGTILRENSSENGYDVIVLNFPLYEKLLQRKGCARIGNGRPCISPFISILRDGGADFIERNAFVLVELLQRVNNQLRANGSTEKIVLIGPSMGGLISRYALRYMEQQGIDHNTKLWVSFDSPHLGANIPIGLQLLSNYFGNKIGVKEAKMAFDAQIGSPAARQMLLSHYLNGTNTDGILTYGNNEFRDYFLNNLNALGNGGFPQNACLRKVALNNGSKSGTQQNFTPCQEALQVKFEIPALDTKVFVTPSGGTNSFCTVFSSQPNWVFNRFRENTKVRGRADGTSLDLLPGSTFESIGLVADASRQEGLLNGLTKIGRTEVHLYFNAHCFIPSASAYALRDASISWGSDLSYINSSNATQYTPFDAIYAPTINENHVGLTQAGVTFVRQQIALSSAQSCGTTPPATCNLPRNNCYTIKVEASGKRLQAMADNTLKQQNANGGNDQIWKVEDRGNGRVSFTTQDGSGRAIRAANGANSGDELTVSSYVGNGQQDWAIQCSPADQNLWRVSYPANNNTWDVRSYGNDPQIQIWGNTSDSFFNHRSFRFEAASCPSQPTNCNFSVAPTVADGNPNRSCSQAVTLNANCSGADCGTVSYSWSGIGGSGSSVGFNVPGTNGSYPYTVTASKVGCANQTGSVTITVSGCSTGTTLPTNACYTINIDQTGKRLQAMGDNSVQQQTSNGATNQIWKVEDRGNGQVSFAVQDGTGRSVQTVSGGGNGEAVTLGGYNGNSQQKWSVGNNPSATTQWRVSNASTSTWDMAAGGSQPQLQIWGTTAEAFYSFRSFRFEAVTCPGQPANCNFTVAPTVSDANPNRSCSQAITLNANCAGADCGSVSYSWSGNGISGSGSSVGFNVPGTNGSYPYTVTASKVGCANQTGSVTITVSGCSTGTTLPTNACYTINIDQTGKRLQAMGDNSVQQQTSNGATNQIWKVEDRGNGQVSFAVQDGTGRSMQTVNGGNNGDAVTLGVYSGGAQQKWNLGNNPSATSQWRVSNASAYTWDMAAEATLPQLQIWGNTGQGFYSYRSFRFEAVTCPNGRMAAMETRLEDVLDLHVSPNPSNGQVVVRFQTQSGQETTLRFADLTGRSVRPAQIIAGTGQVHEERIILPASVQDIIIVSVESGTQQASRKVMIER